MRSSYRTFIKANKSISEKALTRISTYKRKDISNLLSEDITSNNSYWKTLTLLTQVLFYHPNSIVRHEASFVLGEFKYRGEIEKNHVIHNLRCVIRSDNSVVSKHEAIETLGELLSIPESVGAGTDLAKILRFKELYHPDVVATAEEAFEYIIAYLKKEEIDMEVL